MNDHQIREALQALQAAADSPFGYAIVVDPFGHDIPSVSLRGKGILYQVRHDFPHLRALQVRFDPDNPNTGLWIVKLPKESPKPDAGELQW